jgi:hypothetical protein
MPSKDEKARRQELLHGLRGQQRQKTRDAFPAPIQELKELFDFLDERLSDSHCDDSLRFTREFVRQHAMEEDRIIRWLEEHGGHCDCEALNNVEEIVAEAVGGYDRIRSDSESVNWTHKTSVLKFRPRNSCTLWPVDRQPGSNPKIV